MILLLVEDYEQEELYYAQPFFKRILQCLGETDVVGISFIRKPFRKRDHLFDGSGVPPVFVDIR